VTVSPFRDEEVARLKAQNVLYEQQITRLKKQLQKQEQIQYDLSPSTAYLLIAVFVVVTIGLACLLLPSILYVIFSYPIIGGLSAALYYFYADNDTIYAATFGVFWPVTLPSWGAFHAVLSILKKKK